MRLPRLLSPPRPATSDSEIALEFVNGTAIVVLPGVFNGIRFHTGAFMAETLSRELVPAGASVLDLGTGSGVSAIFAARLGRRVVATDINPDAVRCATINALAHRLEHVIETRTGDLFAPIGAERFDVVVFNPPYFYGAPADAADAALRSTDAFARFLAELPAHLTPGGRALIVTSPETDVEPELWTADHLVVSRVRVRHVLGKIINIFELRPR